MLRNIILMAVFAACNLSYAARNELRVMSYNVRHLAGMDLIVNPSRTAAVISTQCPDIVMLQEVDSCCTRTGSVDQLHVLAGLTGLHPTFGRAIPLGGGAYGVGILSREKPLAVRRVPLPGEEPRVLLIAEFKDYAVGCTHLALETDERLESAEIILQEIASFSDKPIIIAGDWNDHPESQLLQTLRSGFFIATPQVPTFPADAPVECLDYIAVSRNCPLQVYDASVVCAPNASDHRPVTATIAF